MLELLPLPSFARASLPPRQPLWQPRKEMSKSFTQPLSSLHYRRILTVLNVLEEHHRIALTSGHDLLAESLERIIELFQSGNKAAMLARSRAVRVKFDKYGRSYTVGTRKTSTARVWMIPAQQPEVAEPLPKESITGAYSTEPVVSDPFERLSTEQRTPVVGTQILINNRPIHEFFLSTVDRERVVRPLKLAGVLGKFNIFVLVHGGGVTGHADATAVGIAKGIVGHRPKLEFILRKGGS